MAERESPLNGAEPTEKGIRALDRIRERFKVEELPRSLRVMAGSESGISDLYMNLNRQLGDGKLEERTKLLVAVAVASASGGHGATHLLSQAAVAAGRTPAELVDAVSVATVCSIFNGYYRFRHQVSDSMRDTFGAFRAPFNANIFMKSALSQVEVEAICVAVSSVNNCHLCVEGHINKARSLGVTDEQIDELIRVAAVASATAHALAALAPEPVEPAVQ